MADRGWRLPLGLAGVPGLFILFAGLALPESPASLAERGRSEEAKKASYLSFSAMEVSCSEQTVQQRMCRLLQFRSSPVSDVLDDCKAKPENFVEYCNHH